MASWATFASAEPALATRVGERFAIRKHKTMATLRRDGSPRISGTEIEFVGGEIFLGVMPGSVKAFDLRRDARFALHGPTDDAPPGNDRGWAGEAKISGHAVEVPYENSAVIGALRFRLDISEVVLVHLNDAGDLLVLETWLEGRGVARVERR